MDIPNHGVSIELDDGLGVYTAIGQLIGLTPPQLTRGVTPVPAHDDTGGIAKFPDALYDGGNVSIRVKHDPVDPTHDAITGMREAMDDGVLRVWRIIMPDAGAYTYDFSAYVTAFSEADMPANAGVKILDVTLAVSGDITAVP
jgi:hypothetical protein